MTWPAAAPLTLRALASIKTLVRPTFTLSLVLVLSFVSTLSVLWGAFSLRMLQESEVRVVQSGVILERPIETYLEVTAVTKDRTALVARVESRAFGAPLDMFMRIPESFLLTERNLVQSHEGIVTGTTEPRIRARETLAPGMKGRAVIRLDQDGAFTIMSLRIGDSLPSLYNGQRADVI